MNILYKIWQFDKWRFVDQGINTFQRRMVHNLLRAWFCAGSGDHFPTRHAWLNNSDSACNSFSRGVMSGLFKELRIPNLLSCGTKWSHNHSDIVRSPLTKPRRIWWESKLKICCQLNAMGWNCLRINWNGVVWHSVFKPSDSITIRVVRRIGRRPSCTMNRRSTCLK